MKRKSIICDMCGREIDKGDARIKAKIREPDSYVNQVGEVRHMHTLL